MSLRAAGIPRYRALAKKNGKIDDARPWRPGIKKWAGEL
jgi:hypothetical protein